MRSANRLVRTARDRGVRPEPLDRFLNTVERFERVVRAHAGDRKTFNSLIAGLVGKRDPETELSHRRAAFQANSHIWGTQVRTRLVTLFAHPATDELADVLWVGGSLDLCRITGSTPYKLTSTAAINTPGEDADQDRLIRLGHPLTSGDITTPGSTLLTEFGTQPLPRMRNYVDRSGRLVVEVEPEQPGLRHAVTAYVAERYVHATNRYRSQSPDDRTFAVSAFISAPVVLAIVDLAVARGTFGPGLPTPRAYMVANLRGGVRLLDEIDDEQPIDILESLEIMHLGQGTRAVEAQEVPRYPELFRHVCGQVGWDPENFDIFRCRVEYPVMSTSIVAGFELQPLSAAPGPDAPVPGTPSMPT